MENKMLCIFHKEMTRFFSSVLTNIFHIPC